MLLQWTSSTTSADAAAAAAAFAAAAGIASAMPTPLILSLRTPAPNIRAIM